MMLQGCDCRRGEPERWTSECSTTAKEEQLPGRLLLMTSSLQVVVSDGWLFGVNLTKTQKKKGRGRRETTVVPELEKKKKRMQT